MTPHIVDRRLNPRDKTYKNRKRFIDLHKEQVQQSVRKILDDADVDIGKSKKRIIVNPTSEPTFQNDHKTGNKEYVLPGNKTYSTGDTIPKPPQNGGGKRGREGSPDGEGEDEFAFNLTEDEFIDFLCDELELPNFVKKQLKSVQQHDTINAGFKSEGNPSQLDIVRSMKNSIGRKIGLKRPKDSEIEALKELIAQCGSDEETRQKLVLQLEEMERRYRAIPWIDPFDIKYRNQVMVPKPHTQAVMFCVMDVSYSMGETEKDIAKRFFMLLNLFLRRKYNNVEVVFISHHSVAREVDEETFFYSRENGGTVVSTALKLCEEIITTRYKPEDWNIYIAQASDGDNTPGDDELTNTIIKRLLKVSQYVAYLEVISEQRQGMPMSYRHESSVWRNYKDILLQGEPKLAMQQVTSKKNVWKVFSNLFHRSKADDVYIYGEKR